MRIGLFFILLYLSLSPVVCHCQAVKGRQELSLGIGAESSYKLLEDHSSIGSHHYSYYSSGTVGISYKYFIVNKFTIGINVSYELVADHTLLNNSTKSLLNDRINFITFAPEVTRSYMDKFVGKNKTRVRLYWLAAWGGTIIHETENGEPDRTSVYPIGFQLTPLGIRFGHSLAGYAEIGFGYKGLLNVGLTYRHLNINSTRQNK